MKELPILRLDLKRAIAEARKDLIAEEEPLHIMVDSHHVATIICSPAKRKELAIGHLLSEGLLRSLDEVDDVVIEGQRCRVILKQGLDVGERIRLARPFARVVLTSCGSPDYWPLSKLVDRLRIPRLRARVRVSARTALEATKALNRLASTFRKTGGVHVAALWSIDGALIAVAEDVGRHNALDKVIGAAALQGQDFSRTLLSTSGRLTGDMVLKASRVGIPVVSSMAAPTTSGIEVAMRTGLTLAGFARGWRMNVYTHPERIAL
ncbi:TPA: formate dehydrogenase accessory sulfurtransferase FdhD [Candidatus Bathyarchaeota archaeon]|nr:formate dehydrogenase accessory sulfurtransferase FdhD [Candidatus Bathyarchaeota archaeon]